MSREKEKAGVRKPAMSAPCLLPEDLQDSFNHSTLELTRNLSSENRLKIFFFFGIVLFYSSPSP